MIYIAVICVN